MEKIISKIRAVILAGGLGTRLRSAVADLPKPMAPVNGKPFLRYQINYLIQQGVSELVVSIGYKGEMISSYFGEEFCGVPIHYIQEETPLGTGGALHNVINKIEWGISDYFLLVNGDTWFEINLKELMGKVWKLNKPITMTLKYMKENSRYGEVMIEGELVKKLSNDKNNKTYINAGWYVLSRNFLSSHLATYPERFSFEEDVLRPLALEGSIAAVIQNKNFLDIGIPEDYYLASSLIRE